MSSATVTFIGWNSSTRAWNTLNWNESPAFDLTATGGVGQSVQEGDAVVSVTGVAGTGAVGDTFTTNMGVSGTTSIGAISTTRGDKAFVTGIAGTGAVGETFTTNMGVSATASVSSATAGAVGNANIFVTGISCTGIIGTLKNEPWGQIIPDQNPNFLNITPSQDPSWANIESGRAAQDKTMASVYTNDLRLEEIGSGEQSGSWGDTTNTNLELIAEAFGFGTEAITTNADTHTTTIADGASDPGRAIFLKYTGTLDSACTITLAPNTVSKLWFIENGTSGSQNIILSQGSGANITIPPGDTKAVYSNGGGSGAVMVDAFASLSVVDLKVQDDLTVTGDLDVDGAIEFDSLSGTGSVAITDILDEDNLASDSATKLATQQSIKAYVDANTGGTLSEVLSNGNRTTAAEKIEFRDAAIFINSSADGQLDIVADTEIQIAATTIDINGAIVASGDVTFETGADIITASAGTSNFRAGVNAGNSITSGGNYNTAAGDEAGTALTVGGSNTALGFESLKADTAGSHSVAIGVGALYTQNFTSATNAYNTAVGRSAGVLVTTGTQNTLIGGLAGDATTTGASNTAVGYAALGSNTTASNNTAVGRTALFTNTTGAELTAVGRESLLNNTTGSNSTAMGRSSMRANTTGANNVGIGYSALAANTTASQNTAVGMSALLSNTTAANNTATGTYAMRANTTGANNTAVGAEALKENTTGLNNAAFGYGALLNNTTGRNNTANGYYSLITNTTGTDNTAYGYGTMMVCTTGYNNVAIGGGASYLAASMQALTTGYRNTGCGAGAAAAITTGANNVAMGDAALYNCTTEGQNTAIGTSAMIHSTTGYDNVAIGYIAGSSITTGYNNCLIGTDTGIAGAPGGNITTANNQLVVGDENITNAHTQVDWTIASDQRDKTDFTDLDLGLDFVKALAPVTYKWDKRSKYGDKYADDYDLLDQTPDGTHKEDWLDIGFKAQEVEALEQAAGYNKSNNTNLVSSHTSDGKQMGLQYSKFVPILVKAIQEQNALIEALTARIVTLEG